MGACAAAGFPYVELGSVGGVCKYHVADAVSDAVFGISGKVIKKLDHVHVCVLGG